MECNLSNARKYGPWIVSIAIWTVLVLLLSKDFSDKGPQWLFDSDCYMRLARVREIMEQGQYPFLHYGLSNPPVGETTPWNLPMDLLLISGGSLLAMFTGDFDRALYLFGWWVSPLLFLITCGVACISARKVLGEVGTYALAALLPLTQPIINYYFPARPDHHGLIHFWGVIGLVGFLHWQSRRAVPSTALGEQSNERFSRDLGLLGLSLMFWTSLEGAALIFFCGTYLAGLTVFSKDSLCRSRAGADLKFFALFLAGLLAAFIILEHGWRPDCFWVWDSVSFRHVTAILVFGLAWNLSMWMEQLSSLTSRMIRMVICGGFSLTAFGLGSFLQGRSPEHAVQQQMFAYLTQATTDAMPLYAYEAPIWSTIWTWYGLPLFLFPPVAVLFLKSRSEFYAIRLWTVAMTAGYLLVSILQFRWNLYASTGLLFFAAWGIGLVIQKWMNIRRESFSPVFLRTLAALLLCLLVFTVNFTGRWLGSVLGKTPANTNTAVIEPLLPAFQEAWERDRSIHQEESRRVLSHIAVGPHLMYQWRAEVLGTPYYRNGAGMEQAFDWLYLQPSEQALAEAREAGWKYVLILTGTEVREWWYYRRYKGIPSTVSAKGLDALLSSDSLPSDLFLIKEVAGPKGTSWHLRLIRLGKAISQENQL